MIPRLIHYCWFGGKEKPKLAKKCIDSWKRYMPDYKLIEWNEENFNININPYVKACYDNGKFAFLTDYVRLSVIYQYGGIYFDTDVEVLKSFDDLLDQDAFIGFETDLYVNSGQGLGAEIKNPIIKQMLEEYYILLEGEKGTIGCPILNTRALLKYGLHQNGRKQQLDGIVVYPKDYFNPYDDSTGLLEKTNNTYSIHWYGKSWMSKRSVLRNKISKPIHRLQRFLHKSNRVRE